MRVFSTLFLVAPAVLMLACSDGGDDGYYDDTAPSRGGDPATTASNPTPILVDVDTGKTMSAAPGDGVGIFVEYTAGGQWHVWWTCDTNKTRLSCAFDVQIAVKSGTLSDLALAGAAQGDTIQQADAQTLHAVTTTTSNAVDVQFSGDPRGIIEITASVGGVPDSSFFFFVQDGVVNGGYDGKLTNPLRFEGSSP